jgi:hypothetical protein
LIVVVVIFGLICAFLVGHDYFLSNWECWCFKLIPLPLLFLEYTSFQLPFYRQDDRAAHVLMSPTGLQSLVRIVGDLPLSF